MASKIKQIRNPFVRFIGTEARLGGAGQAQGPYMNRISGSAHARAVNLRPGQERDIADFQAFGGLNGVIKALIKGQGSVTFARSTEATVKTAPENLIETARENEIRFENGRRVENLFDSQLNDVSSWNAVGGGTISQGSGPGEFDITVTTQGSGDRSETDANVIENGAGVIAGEEYLMTFEAKTNAANAGNGIIGRLQRYTGGADIFQQCDVVLTESWTRFTTPIVAPTDAANNGLRCRFFGSITPGDFCSEFSIKNIHIDKVTGQANKNPSEYVSVGVASAPEYHGVNVDGVRYYARTNPNRVGSNDEVISDVATTPLDDFRALFEPGVTSYINEPADFTLGANWVATGSAGTSQSSLDSSLKGFKLWRLEETTGSTGTRGITSNVHTKAAQAEVWHAEIIARPDQIGWIKLGIENSAETSYVFQFFNLSTGAVGGNFVLNWGHIRGESEQLANGDWRFRVFGVTNNETSIRLRCNLAEADNDDFFNVPAGDGCYIQAANLKQEDAASSFVYSTGGSGSRSADNTSPMFDFANWSQTEGTWYTDFWASTVAPTQQGVFNVTAGRAGAMYLQSSTLQSRDSSGSVSARAGVTADNRFRGVIDFGTGDTLELGHRDIDGSGSWLFDPTPKLYSGLFTTNNTINVCHVPLAPFRMRDFTGYKTRKGLQWIQDNI